jgi:Mg-chelatase subunit ChlD
MFFIATLFMLTPLRAQNGDTPTFKTGVADVRVDVMASQGQDLINSLTKDDFAITDEGKAQPIISFGHGDESLNLILLLDISGSMQTHIEQIAKTARQALAHLRPGDRVAIMVFA